jgi:hypothetical protein
MLCGVFGVLSSICADYAMNTNNIVLGARCLVGVLSSASSAWFHRR